MAVQDPPEPLFNVTSFALEGVRLTIQTTDGNAGATPPDIRVERENGIRITLVKQNLDSPTSKYWREHIANELVHKFLLMDRQHRHRYVLTDFPAGYFLYRHTKAKTEYEDPRKDSYLYGGGYKFRSTFEVLCHFAWLIRGMPYNRCLCIYDNRKQFGRSQGKLNKYMDAKWVEYLTNEERRKLEDFRQRRQEGRAYVVPRPPVNVFNDAVFLRPET